MSSTRKESTVIIGAGIIGCATAYYLSRHSSDTDPQSIHIVECSNELFASASGKAGGFLAEDWFAEETASLGALSYRLHRELAEEFDGYRRWGYSQSTGTSLTSHGSARRSKGEDWLRSDDSRVMVTDVHETFNTEGQPAWLTKRQGDRVEVIGEEGSVAQVDPLRLSQFLLHKSIEAGVTLHQPAEAIRLISNSQDGETMASTSTLLLRRSSSSSADHSGDEVIGTPSLSLPCTNLLLTAGAWTPRVFDALFPHSTLSIPILALAGHSLVVRSPYWKSSSAVDERHTCHAVFTTLPGGDFSPEIFSRAGNEIYIAGLNDAKLELPEKPEDAKVDQKCIAKLVDVAKDLIRTGSTGDGRREVQALAAMADRDELEIVRDGLCFRPVTRRGTPIIASVDKKWLYTRNAERGGGLGEGGVNVFVAAGHGPWGISQSLGTGLVMSEMLEGKKTSADVSRLGV